jgi:hypothetical protein
MSGCGGAAAQEGTSQVRGRVTDQQGRRAARCHVVVTNQDSGTFREAVSGADGSWFMAALPPGRYQVAAQIQGFKKFLRRDVTVAGREPVDRRRATRARRRRGDRDGVRSVSDHRRVIERDRRQHHDEGALGDPEHRAQLHLLCRPAARHRADGEPGVVGIGHADRQRRRLANNSYSWTAAGTTTDYLGQNNGAQARVPLDAAQEFQVLTGQFDAEFGRTSGAIVNAVIKSGTNRFHGSAFEFFYNRDLRALDFFQAQNNLAKADTQKHEFGGLAGRSDQAGQDPLLRRPRAGAAERRADDSDPARPDLNYTTITETRVIDSVYRVDHQISASTSWGARWVTEFSPQKNQTNNAAVTLTAAQQEWDRDDTGSIHVNSVLGTNRVNTVRLSLTREDDRFAPNGFPGCKQNSRSASCGARTSTTASRPTRRR